MIRPISHYFFVWATTHRFLLIIGYLETFLKKRLIGVTNNE